MANCEFNGDVSSFNEIQLNFIRNILEKRGFINSLISVEPVGKAGDNYQSVIKRIIVKTNGIPFQMIAKVAPTNDFMRNMAHTGVSFKNEIIMYGEVFPKFKEIFQSAQIEKNELRTPECYGYLSDPPNELILLEDLQLSNLCLLDKFKPFTDESMKLVLKNLALLHSLSYVLKDSHSELFLNIKNNLQNSWSLMGSDAAKGFFYKMEEDIIKLLDDDQLKAAAKGTVTEIANQSIKLLTNDEEPKYAVILQGDCWINNILFRLENGKPEEAVMIDYQASKVGRPVVDFLYVTLICTDHETRVTHYGHWIDYYHMELEKSLQKFGLQIEIFYPRDVFNADLKTHGKFGLSLSLALTFPMLGDVSDTARVDMPKLLERWLGSQNLDMQNVMQLLGSNTQNPSVQNFDFNKVMETMGLSLQNLDLKNLDMQKIMGLLAPNAQNVNLQNSALQPETNTPESRNTVDISKSPSALRMKYKIEGCIKSAFEFGLI